MSAITMDTVRGLIERHSDHISGNTREFYNGAYAEIADELNSRADYHGYEQAAIEAWESIKAWNSRAERTCKIETDHDELEVIAYSHEDTWAYRCSACDWSFRYDRGIKPSYCPNCGRKCI